VSDDADGFNYRSASMGPGRRRVPMLIAIPVVAGCAALGTLVGVLRPLGSSSPADQHQVEPAQVLSTVPGAAESSQPLLRSESPTAVPSILAAAPAPAGDLPQRPEQSGRVVPTVGIAARQGAPEPVYPFKTGSVEQPPLGVTEDVARGEDAARSEASRLARAKKTRRAYIRRLRPSPPGSATEKFFSSLFPIMPK
jgi:hypothetical protein